MGVNRVNLMSAEHKSFLIAIKGPLQRPSAQIHFLCTTLTQYHLSILQAQESVSHSALRCSEM